MPDICIIGLGNPGLKYNGTRHNIGKDWVKSVTKDIGLDLQIKKKIESTVVISSDQKILWGFPNHYVNESGQSVKKILQTSNLDLKNIIVIHDDLDLPIGTLKIKEGGGHGGHNGLKSVISTVGKSFLRLRVGIGHPGNKVDVTNWVLGKFKPSEKKILIESFYNFNNIINLLGDGDIQSAQLKLHSN